MHVPVWLDHCGLVAGPGKDQSLQQVSSSQTNHCSLFLPRTTYLEKEETIWPNGKCCFYMLISGGFMWNRWYSLWQNLLIFISMDNKIEKKKKIIINAKICLVMNFCLERWMQGVETWVQMGIFSLQLNNITLLYQWLTVLPSNPEHISKFLWLAESFSGQIPL